MMANIFIVIYNKCLLNVILHIKYVGNDSDVVGDLPPMMYTLMVEATNTTGNNPPQYASDIVGLITLTGGSSGCM